MRNMRQIRPFGRPIGFGDLVQTDSRGTHVEVFAHKLGASSYTLEGSASYYVKAN